VVFVQFSSDINGSAISGLQLANAFRTDGWRTVVIFAHTGPMEDRYRDAGHKSEVIEHKSWLRRSGYKSFLKDVIVEYRNKRKFYPLLKRVNPDIIYINTSVSLAAAVAAKQLRIPLIWHLREMFENVGGELKAPAYLVRFVSPVIAYLSTTVVANSSAVANSALGSSKSKQAIVVHNGVDDNFFTSEILKEDARGQLRLPVQSCIIGVPGTLRSVKGHKFFLNAVAKIVHKYPHLVIVISGSGNAAYENTLCKQICDLRISERVYFVGALPNLIPFYRACDIVCVPSRSETFGRVVVEALAMSTPIVATAVGGISEIIENKLDGLLVDYGNEQMLADALDRLLGDEEIRSVLAHNGRKKAWQKYRAIDYKNKLVSIANGSIESVTCPDNRS
jgi:glycosyltransferase involved in cell wall biosynthesis